MPNSEATQKKKQSWTAKVAALGTELAECELSLQEKFQAKEITKREFLKRQRIIAYAKNDLIRMKTHLEQDQTYNRQLQLNQLPSPELGPQWFSSGMKFFRKMSRTVLQLSRELDKLLPLLERASCDRLRWTDRWHSKRLRRLVFQLQQSSKMEEERIERLNAYILRLQAACQDQKASNNRPVRTIQSLSEEFVRRDRRLAAARAQFKEEKRQLLFLQNWLQESRQRLSTTIHDQPPSIPHLQKLKQSFQRDELENYLSVKHRLTVAKTYLRHSFQKLRSGGAGS